MLHFYHTQTGSLILAVCFSFHLPEIDMIKSGTELVSMIFIHKSATWSDFAEHIRKIIKYNHYFLRMKIKCILILKSNH